MQGTVRNRVDSGIADLFPGIFAMVMATGIVSVAAHLLTFHYLALPLLWINIFFYSVLCFLTAWRIFRHSERFFADFADHARGVGFFTIIAGTCVLGTQLLLLLQAYLWAEGLFIFGGILWLAILYGLFARLIFKNPKPGLEKGMTGAWLISVVSTQSIAVLAALLSVHLRHGQHFLLFAALILFLIGGLLYLMIVTLIFYRFMFFPLTPKDFLPSYWVNMGAAAITTLAGATLVLQSGHSPLLSDLNHFLLGFTLFFWAAATWWIPLLVILQIRRFRATFAYDPHYWSMVFPLGMYTACTVQLAKVPHLEFLAVIPEYFIYAAVAAWVVTFFGLLKSIGRLWTGGQS